MDAVERAVSRRELTSVSALLATMPVSSVVRLLERLDAVDRAVVYRLLAKSRALEVFDGLDPTLQSDLVKALQDEDVTAVFAGLDPDDRVSLLDELPAGLATRLLSGLPADQREVTSIVLGYPQGSIGRRMSPEVVTTHPGLTVALTLQRIRQRIHRAETVYTVLVTDHGRRLVGVVSLRELLEADPESLVEDLVHEQFYAARATDDAEIVARRSAGLRLLAAPVVDAEQRLVGILTVDDALRILEEAESEDQARMSGSKPLRRPYLATPVASIVRSRVVWLYVLAVGAVLTVQVLEIFEATLSQVTTLSLFIPLLIGTGGNTGNQAATTITRALALQDVRPRDILTVLAREARVGFSLGFLLGGTGLLVAGLVYGPAIGVVIGLTLLGICTMSAVVGAGMPVLARAERVDPAVFSNPFNSTFVDASGLVIYFLIATTVLGL